MKIHRNDSSRPAPGVPWLLAFPRHWSASVASHVGVAVLTTLLLALVRHFGPSAAPPVGRAGSDVALPAPNEISVEVRGGTDAPEGPHVRALAPHDLLDLVVRHNGHRSEETKLLVRAQLLSGVPGSGQGFERSALFIELDPRRTVWHAQSLRYRGRIDEAIPLAPGLWRITFMLCDRRECEPQPLHECAKVETWLRVLPA